MIGIRQRAWLRFWLRHPVQLLLAVLGVALGVGMVVAVDLAISSTRKAYDLSMAALTGRATHQIVGTAAGLDEGLYAELRVARGLRRSAPVVEGYVQSRGETLRLIGFDPFAEAALRPGFAEAGGRALERLLREPATVLISRRSAARLGVRPGQRLAVTLPGREHVVTVVGLIEGADAAAPALEGLLLADIATAQELLGRIGRLDRIDLELAPAEAQILAASLPRGVELLASETRARNEVRMTAAFETNLLAMSLLALLVGLYLIYNTLAFAVLQRRGLIATLRLVGVTRRQVLVQLLAEALALGAAGSLVGLALGWTAAGLLLKGVTRTINDVYFVLTVTQLLPSPWVLLKGAAIGTGASMLAALPAALEAAGVPPLAVLRRSGLERRWRRRLPMLCGAGLGVVAVGLVVLRLPSTSLLVALCGLFLLTFGYSLLTPPLLWWVTRGLGWVLGRLRWALAALALRGLGGTLSRSGVALAALTLALAVGVGVGVMIGSFRTTVQTWLGQLLQADVYVSLPAGPGRSSEPLPAELVRRLMALPEAGRHSLARRVLVHTAAGSEELLALTPAPGVDSGFLFKHGSEEVAWRRFLSEPVVLVSEPYAYRHGVKLGDRVHLRAAGGLRPFEVAGVVFDYRSDQGFLILHRDQYRRWWGDEGVSSVGLYAMPGVPVERLHEAALDAVRGPAPVVVRSNRQVRESSLELFDRTFAITAVLRFLAVGVAFIGIVGALLAQLLERSRELAVLRATGMTPRQVLGLALAQSVVLGALAGVLALPLGLVLGAALVQVINLRSFGWSMQLSFPPGPLWQALMIAVVAAVLAGLYPAWRMARATPAVALREE